MRRIRPAWLLLSLPMLAVIAACATQTRILTNWALPAAEGEDFGKVALVGIMQHDKENTTFESSMAEVFTKHGVQAVPGFTFMEGKRDLSREAMEKRVAGSGADAVLIFKVIAVDKSSHYVPPTTYVTPLGVPDDEWWEDRYWGYYNPYPYDYWGYWYPAEQVITTPAYWETSKTFVVQSSLYRTSDHKLVWTATSDTYNPTDPVQLADSLGKVVYKKLMKAGLVIGH